MEFEKIKNEMLSPIINTTAAKEHVTEVEHQIRTLKEWVWGILNTLPFNQFLHLIIIELIHFISY